MSDIEIVLKESNPAKPTKSRSWRISLPADVPVKYVLKALIPKLGLPTQQPDGSQIGYNLYHVQSSRIISDNETLNNAGVAHSDVCLLQRQDSGYPEAEPVSRPGIPQEYFEVEEGPQGALPVIIPSDLMYTDQHVWIDTTFKVGRVGITDFLVQEIFLILGVDLPEEGQRVTAGEVVSSLWVLTESLDEFDLPVFSPISGVISSVNKNLTDRYLRSGDPELIWEDPYGEGWLFTVKPSSSANMEIERLMDAKTYQQFISTI